MSETPAGWYAVPDPPGTERFWDGTAWTDQTRTAAAPPMPPPSVGSATAETQPKTSMVGRLGAAAKGLGEQAQGMVESRRGSQQTWSEQPSPPEAAASPAVQDEAPAGQRDVFKISEEGRNGTVRFEAKGLDRTLKKTVGRDDRQFVPYSSITMVSHDRKRVGRDVVVVHLGMKQYDWKIQTDAEGFVDRLNQLIS